MLRKVVFLYEDSERPNQKIKEITGHKTFGETILKRKTFKMRVLEEVEGESFVAAAYSYSSKEEQSQILQQMKSLPKEFSVIHMRSSFGIRNRKAFKILLEKAQFVQQTMCVEENGKTALFLSKSISDYLEYVMEYSKEGIVDMAGFRKVDNIQTECLVGLGGGNKFLQYINSGFDARVFYAFGNDDYTGTKSPPNKKKNKKENE